MSAANGDSINYRGVLHSLPKACHNGVFRTLSPEETLKRIAPYFRTVGLTRLSDITGLDKIGIPVIASIRPDAKTIATSSGKGTTTEAAMASGAMESIEIFHAENIDASVITMSYEQLRKKHNVIETRGLTLTKNSIFNIKKPEHWILGWDIANNCEVAAPMTQVSMGWSVSAQGSTLSFQVGSNGLASGNHFLEALSSALFEVIERDAISCYTEAYNRRGYQLKRIDPASICYDSAVNLIERFESAHVRPVIFDFTVDTAVPVYVTYLYDLQSRHMGVYKGSGAHLNPEIALVRSLTEAAQSRALIIAGSRDDIFRYTYSSVKINDNDAIHSYFNSAHTMSAFDRQDESTSTFEGDIQLCIKKLKHAGLNRIIVYDLTRPDIGIPVLRVIVPGAEGYMFMHYTQGYRATNFASFANEEATQ
ncbi:MAG: YcaO-like family protein [Nitrospirae bacterium]|nr:YcaO-like family protein [Nitrospirota bacterium]